MVVLVNKLKKFNELEEYKNVTKCYLIKYETYFYLLLKF